MTDYVLWERGLRGPHLTRLQNRDKRGPLSDREKRHKLAGPFELTGMNENMTREEAARMFPLPPQPLET